jgi:lipopolysaccharide/colanic/teichoic acid biosynthesis glycosyltransferase
LTNSEIITSLKECHKNRVEFVAKITLDKSMDFYYLRIMDRFKPFITLLCVLAITASMGTTFYSCNRYGDGTKRLEVEKEKTMQLRLQVQLKGCKAP